MVLMKNDDQTGPGAADDPIRRALKQLPPVKAAPDFEARLHRRLGETERPEEDVRWWQRIFTPARIPAFGYSLMALVAVGFVSYYLFWHSGVAPENAGESVSPPAGRVSPAPPPVLRQGEAPPESEEGGSQPAEAVQHDAKARVQSGARQVQVKKEKVMPEMRRDRAAAPAEAEPKAGFGNAVNEAAPVPPASKDELSSPAQKADLQQNIPSQAKKAGPTAPQLRKEQSLPSAQFNSRAIMSAPAIARDSASIRDSLRMDSLRRANAKKPPR
jgi:hypothetical protein